jgi:uncharacterized protein (DUF1015 family)
LESAVADIRPFRGIRYNDARFADLTPVLAPPYDVISSADYKDLMARSDWNVVRLILGDSYTGARRDPDRYSRVAEILNAWIDDETLVQDRAAAIYVLDQTYTVDGTEHTRRALVARLRLEAFGRGQIHPHEQTMPGPKADRLALMRATQMNLSQVFGLYSDDGSARAVLDQVAELDPIAEGVGADGVRNTVRALYHPRLIEELCSALRNRDVIIADGHHRYETAIAYRDEQRARFGPLTMDEPYEFCSIALVAMDDPGLTIRATHRLVAGLQGFTPAALFERASADFELTELPADADEVVARLGEMAERHAFVIVTPQGSRLFVRRRGRREADGRPENLDVHILHHGVFHRLLSLGPPSWAKGGPVEYVQSVQDCIGAVVAGRANLAAIVNPARIDEVSAIALAGGKMPPKSTFFYPKLPTGVVINPLI